MATKNIGATNENMQKLIELLRSVSLNEKVRLWKRVASDLSKPSRNRRAVNVYKLDKFVNDGEIVVVPGKVLGTGSLQRKVKVAAFNFSGQALEKIVKAGGQAMAIEDLVKENPKGRNVRILG